MENSILSQFRIRSRRHAMNEIVLYHPVGDMLVIYGYTLGDSFSYLFTGKGIDNIHLFPPDAYKAMLQAGLIYVGTL